MYRILVVLVLLLEPALGQIDKAPKNLYVSAMFGDPVEGRPFQARYATTRSWMSPSAGNYSEAESGSLFRDSRGRISKRAEGSEECQRMRGCHWVQDPVTDSFFYGHFFDGKAVVDPLSRVLDPDFTDDDLITNSDGTPRFSSTDKRIRFNLPQPAQLADDDAKRIGRKLIEGLDCEGFVKEEPYRIPGGYKLEYWVSIDLKRIIYEKIKAQNTSQTYRLFNIEMVEPPESEFAIPTPVFRVFEKVERE